MAKLELTITPEGIQDCNFKADNSEDRMIGFIFFGALEPELVKFDRIVKKFFLEDNGKENADR